MPSSEPRKGNDDGSDSEDHRDKRRKTDDKEKDKDKDRDRERRDDRDRDRRGDRDRDRDRDGKKDGDRDRDRREGRTAAEGLARELRAAAAAAAGSAEGPVRPAVGGSAAAAATARPGVTDPAKGKGIGKGRIAPPPRRGLDRSRTCPFLLRVFRKIGGHHGIEAFAERGKEPVDEELQVYTWPDVTLRELADLVKDVAPEARTPNARLAFRLIYPDKSGKNVMTDLGSVTCTKRGPDDDKPLSSTKFQTGDLLDLAIYK